MELHAKGSGGFGINVSGSSSEVYMTVRGHHASNIYMVRGRVGDKEINARFGHLGRVSMRFRVGHKARVREPDGNCKGGGEVIERGSFIGTLNFRGEQGYTTVRTVHAAGRVVKSQRFVCEAEGEEEGGAPGPHWLLFDAISKNGHVSFRASKITSKALPELDTTFFNASIFETHPKGMSVIRTLDAQVDASAFKAGQSHGHIATASATPPGPFRGTAAYQRQGSTSSWTGTLTGIFPGRGEIRLAGPRFCAGFPFPPPKCAPSGSRFVFFG